MDLPTVLSSAVVAGLVAGLVTLRTTERKIAITNITQQRKIWRDKVRDKALEAIKAYEDNNNSRIREIYVEFQLILNPDDDDDKSILDTIWQMYESEESNSELTVELSEKLSLLLKHDWERAKREAKPIFFRFFNPKRICYQNFTKKRNSNDNS